MNKVFLVIETSDYATNPVIFAKNIADLDEAFDIIRNFPDYVDYAFADEEIEEAFGCIKNDSSYWFADNFCIQVVEPQ